MQLMSDKLVSFYQSLDPPKNLPTGVDVLYPQKDKQVMELVEKFFQKYYHDEHPRRLLLGINPGRFGAGITGINFTAPKQLKEFCGIDHHLKLSSELSAEFIYEIVMAYGGVQKFYNDWFIGAVCPLGFVRRPVGPTPRGFKRNAASLSPSKGGDETLRDVRSAASDHSKGTEKNLNYYDDKKLMQAVTPFIIDCINKQLALGFNTDKCICVGGEKNFKFLSALNKEHKWFGEIIPLPHPRFILQYRRKQKEQYIHQYLMAMDYDG
jgi:hypothetical protein